MKTTAIRWAKAGAQCVGQSVFLRRQPQKGKKMTGRKTKAEESIRHKITLWDIGEKDITGCQEVQLVLDDGSWSLEWDDEGISIQWVSGSPPGDLGDLVGLFHKWDYWDPDSARPLDGLNIVGVDEGDEYLILSVPGGSGLLRISTKHSGPCPLRFIGGELSIERQE
jgi:hypothetical protein